jgi:putative integral membrane protein (TIGR02587 family)
MAAQQRSKSPWRTEVNDLVRGASGGFLFGIPLLYTMEVWWIGSSSKPAWNLVTLILTFVAVVLLNQTAGFRKTKNGNLVNVLMDSVEALAIGIVCACIVLVLLREVRWGIAWSEAIGKIIFESLPFSLGVALAASQLLGGLRAEDPQEQDSTRPKRQTRRYPSQDWKATWSDLGATVIGATIIAFNIAPTDEVPMLAAAISGPWLLAIMAASLIISYGIVFAAGFSDQNKRRQQRGIFQRPLSETVASYLVSLVSAALMLLIFQKVTLQDPWSMWLSFTIVLGLPATIGGAAGRLAL